MAFDITLKARWQVVGFHQWKRAKVGREYLAATHRHTFYIQVECRVAEADREVEFHDLLEEGQRALANAFNFSMVKGNVGQVLYDFEGSSCEIIAREILAGMAAPEASAVEVWEDGECGARVEVIRAVR